MFQSILGEAFSTARFAGLRVLLSRYSMLVSYGALLLVIVTFVLLDQADSGGFFAGHHGWVSSHALAIATHVSLENGLLGYAVQSVGPEASIDYHYFDRYPIWFSLLLNGIVASGGSFAEQILAGRLVMNLFYIGTLIGLMALVFRITRSHVAAIGATLLGMSSYYIVQYRDMIHYDQPALFGIVLALHAVLNVEEHGNVRRNLLIFLLAVSLGRGYAVLPLITLWSGVGLWRSIRENEGIRPALGAWLRSPSLKVLIFVVGICSTYLAYNVAMEAKVRDVPVVETSIVDSAFRRLGFSERFAVQRSNPFTWSTHFSLQLQRYSISLIPYPPVGTPEFKRAVPYYVERLGGAAHIVVFGLAAALIVFVSRRMRPTARVAFLLLASSGLVWLAPMKNLVIAHVYTTMYQLGAVVALYGAALLLLPRRPGVQLGVVVVSAAVFLGSVHASNRSRVEDIERVNAVSADFGRIVALVPERARVHVALPYESVVDAAPDIVFGAPYAVAFYLGSRLISSDDNEEYAISRDPNWIAGHRCSTPLTPENKHVFLFRKGSCN